ncbi:MAG: peroxidase [Gemmatimonadota bacterium]
MVSRKDAEHGADAQRRAWIRVVGVADADGELAGAYGRVGARDRVANVIGVHSLHPQALEDHVALYRTLMFGRSPLSRREREAVAVVVSAANDCFY